MFASAHTMNTLNIVSMVQKYGVAADRFCDLGAGDGTVTRPIAAGIRAHHVDAVELEPENVALLEASGYTVHRCDLNTALSIEDDSFDVAVANQVIEHLYDTDRFLEEVHRIVRPGGVAIVSTENLASWHNIGALLLGWQPFSLTNVTRHAAGVGNPLALHAGENGQAFPMQHHRLFTTRTLAQLMALHGFEDVATAGSGYYPLMASFGRVDPTHAHFITVGGRKPERRAL